MARQPWHFFINSFAKATQGSYKKALSLGVNHESRLSANQSDPVIAALLASFSPIMAAYRMADNNLRITLGTYKGNTQQVRELFAYLNTTKLPYWEPRIWQQFPRSSAECTELFPRARRVFQKGTYVQRIQAIKVLGKQCEAIPALQSLSVDILAFHAQIATARTLQVSDGQGQAIKQRSDLEAARIALCTALYGSMGGLMQHYRNSPEQIARYFKLTLVRKKGQNKRVEQEDEESN